jgi:dienelactone hydrolase
MKHKTREGQSIQILNNKDKLVIVVHEIYGINQHMESLCKKLHEQGFDVICPNLLEREQPFCYSEEEIAYQHFMENVGFTNAAHKIIDLFLGVKNNYYKIYVVGFSVGATVAWLCTELVGLAGVVGYYGSRIRDYKERIPLSPTILFFPNHEESFDVNELISYLNNRSNKIQIHKLNGKHGFADPFSPKYNRNSNEIALKEMQNFLMKY